MSNNMKMKKKTVVLIVVAYLAVCALFVVGGSTLFNAYLNREKDPIDEIIREYLYSSAEIEAEYGKVESAGRPVFWARKDEVETETNITRTFGIKTDRGDGTAYDVMLNVELVYENGAWKVTGYEILSKMIIRND